MRRRSKKAMVVVAIVAAACAGETAETTTSVPVAEPTTSTTTTTLEESTTTTVAESVDICRGRAELWEPGAVYTAPCVVVPVSFEVAEEGWRSSLVSERWAYVPWVDPSDTEVDQVFEVGVAVVASRERGGAGARIGSILETEGIVPFSDPSQTAVVGLAGLVVDVEGLPRNDLAGRQCQAAGDVVLIGRDTFGYRIAPGPQDGDFFGVGRCQVARVWVLEAGDFLITIIGGTADPDRHEEAVAKIESLFEGMTFEVPESG
jgi:hypothetical protein